MTEETSPTPSSGTPVWRPAAQPAVEPAPHSAPDAAPSDAETEPWVSPSGPAPAPHGGEWSPQPAAWQQQTAPDAARVPSDWQQSAPTFGHVDAPGEPSDLEPRVIYTAQNKPTPLPVQPKRYHQFFQTPRRRWWKIPLAAVVAVILVVLVSIVVVFPVMIYEAVSSGAATSSAKLSEFLTNYASNGTTPLFFIANNVTIVAMIPIAWLLTRVVYGQRPRWLGSVAGGLRWGWMFRLMGLVLIPYLVVYGIEFLLPGGVPELSWRPYSLFLIVGILLTTPLQCAGEEYGLRGLVSRLAGSYGSPRVSFWISAIVTSVVFMFLHGAADPFLNAFYFSFGMVAAWMVWRTGGLEASIALHVVNNMMSELLMPFSDISGAFDRQAGSANPWDVLPVGLLLLAGVGIVEWQVRRRHPVAVAAPGASEVAPRSPMAGELTPPVQPA